jgi:hypothetical protein
MAFDETKREIGDSGIDSCEEGCSRQESGVRVVEFVGLREIES